MQFKDTHWQAGLVLFMLAVTVGAAGSLAQ